MSIPYLKNKIIMIKNKEFAPRLDGNGKLMIRGRLSYVHLDEPWSGNENNEKKYSVSILIPKEDKATIEAVQKAVELAKAEGKTKKWGGIVPKKLQLPLRDGDEERDDEAYQGCYFFNASSSAKSPVKCFNRLKQELSPSEIYSGCWGLVSLKMFPYDASGNKGVAAGLNQVLFWADDEKLGGGSQGNDFEDLEIDEDEDLEDL